MFHLEHPLILPQKQQFLGIVLIYSFFFKAEKGKYLFNVVFCYHIFLWLNVHSIACSLLLIPLIIVALLYSLEYHLTVVRIGSEVL